MGEMEIKNDNIDNAVPDEYYKDPIIESFTYVGMGMDDLKRCDPKSYSGIKEKQSLLLPEISVILTDIKKNAERLGITSSETESCVSQFLQKFPLAIRDAVVWYDVNFIFLYILTMILKPKIVVETGCNVGFSSAFIALAVKENNNGCKFYTMDISELLASRWEDTILIAFNYIKKQKMPP